MTALVMLNTDGTLSEYERSPSVGQLEGPHALIGQTLAMYPVRIDKTLTLWGPADQTRQPLNRLAWLAYGTTKLHGHHVIGRTDRTAMTGGQVETLRALARTLETYGWERAVMLGRRFTEQDLNR